VPPAHAVLYAVPDYRADHQAAPIGTVSCSVIQHLSIKYGTLTEPMATAPIGHVDQDDIDVLAKVGQAVWDSMHCEGDPIMAEVRRVGGLDGHWVRRQICHQTPAQELLAKIAALSETALVEAPAEVVELHQDRRFSDAGTRDSVVTTFVFVNGETRPLGYMTYTILARAVRSDDMPLASLIAMAKHLLVKPAEFLGYCGLTTLWELTQQVASVLKGVTEKEDFIGLAEQMALYVNALGAWNLQLFPWETGAGKVELPFGYRVAKPCLRISIRALSSLIEVILDCLRRSIAPRPELMSRAY
jgi:cucumopine synthase-like protein